MPIDILELIYLCDLLCLKLTEVRSQLKDVCYEDFDSIIAKPSWYFVRNCYQNKRSFEEVFKYIESIGGRYEIH